LSASSLDEVVRACGVQESTLRRWMAQPSFVAPYYAAESEQLRDSLHRLRASTGDAVEVLRKALRAGAAAVRIRAAAAILRAATLADPDRAGTLRDREGAGVADSAAPGVAHKNSS
jgi:sirohydrochlorin ferrochelatase